MGFDVIYVLAGAIVASVLFFLCSLQAFGVYQQCGYSGKELNAWYLKKENNLKQRYILLSFACFLLTALFALCFSFFGATISNLISAAGLIGMCALFVYSERASLKVPIKRTGRIVRLGVCYYILLVAVVFSACVGFWYLAEAIDHDLARIFRFVPIVFVPVFIPLLLSVAGVIMKGYELPKNKKYVASARQKLQNSSCIKVGITGSFGKTSVKHYAARILSKKFKVLATPASYNTPLGIAETVNKLGLDCDVFLAEMGARHVGDIRELCDIVPLDYAIVTGICNQHFATFGSMENIVAEKGEVAKRAKVTVLGTSALQIEAKNALREGAEFAAEDVVCSMDGAKFRLRIGEETATIETPLLGRHVAEDIALAAALCSLLGMTMQEIVEGIAEIEPIPHRLEKTRSGDLYILDDSYNCNIEGAKSAIEVLKLFPNGKYIVTPGIVELGEMHEQTNAELGEMLVGLDGIILIGETRIGAIRSGYERAGGDKSKIRVVPTIKAGVFVLQQYFERDDCVLFLNDLPDRY